MYANIMFVIIYIFMYTSVRIQDACSVSFTAVGNEQGGVQILDEATTFHFTPTPSIKAWIHLFSV